MSVGAPGSTPSCSVHMVWPYCVIDRSGSSANVTGAINSRDSSASRMRSAASRSQLHARRQRGMPGSGSHYSRARDLPDTRHISLLIQHRVTPGTPPQTGCLTDHAPKCSRKMGLVAHSAAQRDLAQGRIRAQHEPLRHFDPAMHEVDMRRHAEGALEGTAE